MSKEISVALSSKLSGVYSGDALLLDAFGGVVPAFAYGLRRLRSGYTKYALRVRRDADDFEVEVEFDSAGIVSLVSPIVDGGSELTTGVTGGTYSGTLTLGAFAGSDTVYVVKWYDQSGNSRFVYQLTEAYQPALITSGTLEPDGIHFDGSNDFLKADYYLTTTNDHTFHAVVRTDSVGVFGVLGDIDASYNDGAELITVNAFWSHRIDSTDLDVPATTTGKTYVLASYEIALSASNEQQMRVNGVYSERACSETVSFGVANRIRVGARRDTDNEIDGKIAEIIAWNSKVTTAQQDVLESNTLAHHGLAVPYSASSILFDGADDYMDTSADSTLASKSYSFWAKSTLNNSNGVFDHGGDRTGAVIFNWSYPHISLGTNYYRVFDDVAQQHDGNWHHWVAYIDPNPTNCKMYVDGVALGIYVTGTSGSANAYSTGLRIGRGGDNEFDGNLDEFAIFDGELTAAQILAIYSNGKPASIASFSPTSWWRMGDSNDSTDSFIYDEVDKTLGSELITGFTNGSTYPLDTLVTSGRDITSAIETSGNWGGCASNAFSVVAGEVYEVSFDLTYNSGTSTMRALIVEGADGADGSVSDDFKTNTSGVNTAYLTIVTTDAAANLQLGTHSSSHVINFAATNVSLKKIGGNPGILKNGASHSTDTPLP